MLYSSRKQDDILCQNELQKLQAHGPNLEVFYTLTRYDFENDAKWNGMTGKINIGMIQKCGMPLPADDVLIIICGPSEYEATM